MARNSGVRHQRAGWGEIMKSVTRGEERNAQLREKTQKEGHKKITSKTANKEKSEGGRADAQ